MVRCRVKLSNLLLVPRKPVQHVALASVRLRCTLLNEMMSFFSNLQLIIYRPAHITCWIGVWGRTHVCVFVCMCLLCTAVIDMSGQVFGLATGKM